MKPKNYPDFFSEAKLSLTCSATKSPTLSICGGGFCHPIIILFINWLHSADFGMKCKIILDGITFEIRIAGIMLKKHNFQMSWCLHWHSSTCGLCRHQNLTEDCQDGIQVTIMLLLYGFLMTIWWMLLKTSPKTFPYIKWGRVVWTQIEFQRQTL